MLGSRQGERKVTPCSHVNTETAGMLDLGEKSQIWGQPCAGSGNGAGERANKSPELWELGVFLEKRRLRGNLGKRNFKFLSMALFQQVGSDELNISRDWQ